jgi:molybdate transport system ATP-binding protein
MTPDPFITMDNISVRLRDELYLQNTSWRIRANEHWAVLGPNGSGKTTLAKALFGAVPVVRGKIIHHFSAGSPSSPAANTKSIGYVSADLHRQIMEQENLKDRFRDFSGKIDEITSVEQIILGMGRASSVNLPVDRRKAEAVASKLGIGSCLNRDIKTLSVGEVSKVLIARALIKEPQLLILDEPFEGLDLLSRKSMAAVINDLMLDTMRVILITHRFDEIAPNISHVLFLRDGKVFHAGKKETVFTPQVIRDVYDMKGELIPDVSRGVLDNISVMTQMKHQVAGITKPSSGPRLIEMKHVTIRYGSVKLLEDFSWIMESYQNWAICGPAGSGKSTVLKVILGENVQAYANEIYLFGRKKGTGESIWDIRNQVGYVSSELQIRYPKNCSVFDTVISGFYDSFGLYRRCSADQIKFAKTWIKLFDIEHLHKKDFGQLSHGQKQLVLIARAMVKSPVLLMLDEPCEGLDLRNRSRILKIIDLIGRHTNTRLIYIPSMEEEIVPCITNILIMEAGQVIEYREQREGRTQRDRSRHATERTV